ncbi:hypothetical protein IM40_05180 [Candidatus Paracaedimonas acanthamoebae]|nr:hypothetical protein IM40_05180 [Candidatus Paracaedimonas acanthamoebae]
MREKLLPSGQYIVGTVQFDLYDENRPELKFPKGRLIPCQFYFPINKGYHKTYEKSLEPRGNRRFPLLKSVCFSKPSHLNENFARAISPYNIKSWQLRKYDRLYIFD